MCGCICSGFFIIEKGGSLRTNMKHIFVQHEMKVGRVQGTGMHIRVHVLRASARSVPDLKCSRTNQ